MDSLSSRHWQLSFTAWRWRRLLWIVLLVALLAILLAYLAEALRPRRAE